jgi:hypothetical protein
MLIGRAMEAIAIGDMIETDPATGRCRKAQNDNRLMGQFDEVPLYLEAHITIEPVFDERRELATEVAGRFNFKLAELLMKKRAEDTEERSAKDTFMTGHSKSKNDLSLRVQHLVRALQAHGFKVWRYKVEDTLVDSRTNDEWNLIDG